MQIDGDEWSADQHIGQRARCAPTAIADRIFDPFFYDQAGRPRNKVGLILGYGIVSQTIAASWVRNDNVGAVFEIYLPAVGLGERVHEGAPWGFRKNSVVDDEQDALDNCRRIFGIVCPL